MAKYLVTGGAGFIGSNIVKELVKRHQKVKVIDRADAQNNLAEIKEKIEYVSGNIADLKFMQKEFQGIDIVIHQAAGGLIEDPLSSYKVNLTGILNVLLAARDNKVKRVVYASSSAVYGNNPAPLKKEDMALKPLSPYAISKVIDEYYARIFFELYGLETVGLRYFNVYGPGQDPNGLYTSVVPKFILAILQGKRPAIYGRGNQLRDFIYVQNVVEANLLAAIRPNIGGEVFNIAGGKSYNLNQLVAALNKILGKVVKPIYRPGRPGDVKHSKADIKKAKKMLGYRPIVGFEEGLKKTASWYKKN